MTIRTHISLAMAVLLSVAAALIGLVAVQAVTTTMTHRIDDRLRDFAHRPELPPPGVDRPRPEPDDEESAEQYRPFALLFFDAAGDLVDSQPAGYRDDPLPLPDLEGPTSSGTIRQVDAVDGSLAYRVLADPDTRGGTVVAAAPLTEVDEVRRILWLTMAAAVLLVSAGSAIVARWITRRGLRPVDAMIDDAAAVADGDLDRRLTPRRPHTELGRLATALNTMVGRLTDAITERDHQQQRLRRFVADASHELRTPLAAVGGYAELYRRGSLPPGPRLDRAMERVQAESVRLGELVDDLMLLSQLDSDAGGDTELVDLSQLAGEVVADAGAVDPEHDITVEAPRPVVVDGDEHRLRQVVTNLVANARVHTPPGTPVRVTATVDDGEALLTVADRGPGIEARHRDRVFDRFYRADPSRSRDTGGSGLGLAIVDSIVAAHGGTVALSSAPGQGTTVSVRLPLTRRDRSSG